MVCRIRGEYANGEKAVTGGLPVARRTATKRKSKKEEGVLGPGCIMCPRQRSRGARRKFIRVSSMEMTILGYYPGRGRRGGETSECTCGCVRSCLRPRCSRSDQTPGGDENEKVDSRLFDCAKTVIVTDGDQMKSVCTLQERGTHSLVHQRKTEGPRIGSG